jgi:hypothetical protein
MVTARDIRTSETAYVMSFDPLSRKEQSGKQRLGGCDSSVLFGAYKSGNGIKPTRKPHLHSLIRSAKAHDASRLQLLTTLNDGYVGKELRKSAELTLCSAKTHTLLYRQS